jgi:RNA polymerase sigma-70 factor (ECF subfamily)
MAAVREETAELKAAIARLSVDYQQVIRLRSFQRLSFVDVGRRLGRSADAARKLWVRAITRLQRELTSDERSRP